METKRTISGSTGLDPRDIQYIADNFDMKPTSGGQTRGLALQFKKSDAAVFGIIAQLKAFGMTIKAIMDLMEALKSEKEWSRLFDDNDELSDSKIINGQKCVYLIITGGEVDLKFQECKKKMAGPKNALVLEITKSVLLAVP